MINWWESRWRRKEKGLKITAFLTFLTNRLPTKRWCLGEKKEAGHTQPVSKAITQLSPTFYLIKSVSHREHGRRLLGGDRGHSVLSLAFLFRNLSWGWPCVTLWGVNWNKSPQTPKTRKSLCAAWNTSWISWSAWLNTHSAFGEISTETGRKANEGTSSSLSLTLALEARSSGSLARSLFIPLHFLSLPFGSSRDCWCCQNRTRVESDLIWNKGLKRICLSNRKPTDNNKTSFVRDRWCCCCCCWKVAKRNLHPIWTMCVCVYPCLQASPFAQVMVCVHMVNRSLGQRVVTQRFLSL